MSPRMRRLGTALAVLAAFFGCAIGGTRESRVAVPPSGTLNRVPVVFVPGVTGVELRERATGRIVWGTGWNLIRPHDWGYAIARRIGPGSGPEPLEAGGVIRTMSLFGVVRKSIYQGLIDLFEVNGYRLGNLAEPQPGESFFLFAYDWRQDNVESAQRLARQLERLRRVRSEERLRVVLICQSNGAHVCRYLAKYGDASLEQAEAGVAPGLTRLELDKLVLVGASNGGSLRVLEQMHNGRRYVRVIGRRWAPETIFTFASLFQDLPVYSDDLFVNEQGHSFEVDLFDPESWRRFGWSVWGERPQRRLASGLHGAIFGKAEDLYRYLQRALDRAWRFHRLLQQPGFGQTSTRYYLITNLHLPTPARAALVRSRDSWKTIFSGDRALRSRPDLAAVLTEAGDGHATLESQLWLSEHECERLVWDPIEVRGAHFEMILSSVTQRHLMEILMHDGPGGRGC